MFTIEYLNATGSSLMTLKTSVPVVPRNGDTVTLSSEGSFSKFVVYEISFDYTDDVNIHNPLTIRVYIRKV